MINLTLILIINIIKPTTTNNELPLLLQTWRNNGSSLLYIVFRISRRLPDVIDGVATAH